MYLHVTMLEQPTHTEPVRPKIPLANAPSQGPLALKSNMWNVLSECCEIQWKFHCFSTSKYEAQKLEWFRVLSKGLERFRVL